MNRNRLKLALARRAGGVQPPAPTPTPTGQIPILLPSASWQGTVGSGGPEPVIPDTRAGTWPYECVVEFQEAPERFFVGTKRIAVHPKIANLDGFDRCEFWWEGGTVTVTQRRLFENKLCFVVDLALRAGSAGGKGRVWAICYPKNGRPWGTSIDLHLRAADNREIFHVDRTAASNGSGTAASPFRDLAHAWRIVADDSAISTAGAIFLCKTAGDYSLAVGYVGNANNMGLFTTRPGPGLAVGDVWLTWPAGAATLEEAQMTFGVRNLELEGICIDLAHVNSWVLGNAETETVKKKGLMIVSGGAIVKDRRGMNGPTSLGYPIGVLGQDDPKGIRHGFFDRDGGRRVAFIGTPAQPVTVEATNIGGAWMMKNVTGTFGFTTFLLASTRTFDDARYIDVKLASKGQWFNRQHAPDTILVDSVGSFNTTTGRTPVSFQSPLISDSRSDQTWMWVLGGACPVGNTPWDPNRDGSRDLPSKGWRVKDFQDDDTSVEIFGDVTALAHGDPVRIMYDDHGGDNGFAVTSMFIDEEVARNWSHTNVHAEHPGLQMRLNQPWNMAPEGAHATPQPTSTFSFDAATHVGTFGGTLAQKLIVGMTVVTATGWGTVRKLLPPNRAEFYQQIEHATGAIIPSWPGSFPATAWSRGRDILGWGSTNCFYWGGRNQNADIQGGCNHFYLGCSLIALVEEPLERRGLSYEVALDQIVGVVHRDCIFGNVYGFLGNPIPNGWTSYNAHYYYENAFNRDVGSPSGGTGRVDFNSSGFPTAGLNRTTMIATEIPYDANGQPRANGVSPIGAFAA